MDNVREKVWGIRSFLQRCRCSVRGGVELATRGATSRQWEAVLSAWYKRPYVGGGAHGRRQRRHELARQLRAHEAGGRARHLPTDHTCTHVHTCAERKRTHQGFPTYHLLRLSGLWLIFSCLPLAGNSWLTCKPRHILSVLQLPWYLGSNVCRSLHCYTNVQ